MDGTAVVTGASRGIGAAVAREFADAGAHVVVCSRESEEVDRIAEGIQGNGGAATAMRADVRDEYDVERLMETAARVDGGINYVVPAAGVYHGSPGETPIARESYAAVDDHVRTNLRGVFATVREAVPHLSADARVLVPTGRVAREATAGMGSYAVSKAGAEALARQFAVDLDRTVGCVDPGQVETELSGAGGRDPGEVAGLFRWAATELPDDDLDGEVVGLREWLQTQR